VENTFFLYMQIGICALPKLGASRMSMRMQPDHKPDKTGVPFRERLFCSVADAVTASGICRSSIYTEMKRGTLEFQKRGKRTLVSVPSLLKLLDVA